MRTTLYQSILLSARKACELQAENGAMPAGHNGLYKDKETSVRNTAHWLITFLKAYQIQPEPELRQAAEKALSYLMGPEARPQQYTFWHRDVPGKDRCNGLMGQAWTIEALVEAASFLEDDALLRLAEEVFLLHPFDRKASLWHRVDIDGSRLSFDMTFNHQLWFAAAGGLLSTLSSEKRVKALVTHFMDQLTRLLNIYDDGLVHHLIEPAPSVKEVIKAFLQPLPKYRKLNAVMRYKAVGYHSFNMYAFGLLKGVFQNHAFWQSDKFMSALRYMSSRAYKKAVINNKYAYPYNPPGFEVPFAMEVLDNALAREKANLLSSQFRHGFSLEENMFSRNTEDPNTASARLYEATRMKDIALEF